MDINMNAFKDVVLAEIPRILGLGDRFRGSRTFGCFDRYYWHYKLSDMPNARFQEAAFLLMLLYKNDFEGNIYYQNANAMKWIEAAVKYWKLIRNRDGSLNEIYPFERSFCATSFSTFAVTEAMLGTDIGTDDSLKITGRWLTRNNNKDVSNQMAASALALYNLYLLLNDEGMRASSEEKVAYLIKAFETCGYFPEYGGFDLGYETVTASILSRLNLKLKSKGLDRILKQSVGKIESELDENGNYDYGKMSRQTQFVYPYGLAAQGSPALNKMCNGITGNTVLTPAWMDDRYVVQLTTDYLLTFLYLDKGKTV